MHNTMYIIRTIFERNQMHCVSTGICNARIYNLIASIVRSKQLEPFIFAYEYNVVTRNNRGEIEIHNYIFYFF